MGWILSILLAILLLFLLLIVLLLCSPLTVELLWKEERPGLKVGIGPVRVDVLWLQKKMKPWLDKRKQKAALKGKKPKEEKKKEPWYTPGNLEKKLDLLRTWAQPVRNALVRLGKKLRLCRLEVDMVVAGEDPGSTGMLYGWGCTLLGGLCGAIESCCTIRHGRVTLTPDFASGQKSIEADVVVSIRIWHLLVIGVQLMQEYMSKRPAREKQHQMKAV